MQESDVEITVSDRIFRGIRLSGQSQIHGARRFSGNLLVMCPLSCQKLLWCLFVCGVMLTPHRVSGQQTGQRGVAGQSPAASDTVNIGDLVRDLSAQSFAVRQRATSALLRLDQSALPALNEALSVATGEAADRLRQVQRRLTERWFQSRLQRLQAEADVSAADWPDWQRFVKMSGAADQPADRQRQLRGIFLQLVQSEPELFAARAFEPGSLSGLLEVRAQLFAESCDGREDRPFSAGSGLALMLLGSDSSVRLLRATSASVSRAFDDPRFSELVSNGVHAESVRGVVSGWLLRPGISADRPLLFAMRHRLPAGRELAVRVLQADARGPQLYYACMCLAVLESRADLSLLEGKFSSAAVIWPVRGAAAAAAAIGDRPSGFQVQLGDAALAAAVVLRGGHPQDLGVPAEASEVMLFRMDSVGCVSAAEREGRLQRYRQAYPTQP